MRCWPRFEEGIGCSSWVVNWLNVHVAKLAVFSRRNIFSLAGIDACLHDRWTDFEGDAPRQALALCLNRGLRSMAPPASFFAVMPSSVRTSSAALHYTARCRRRVTLKAPADDVRAHVSSRKLAQRRQALLWPTLLHTLTIRHAPQHWGSMRLQQVRTYISYLFAVRCMQLKAGRRVHLNSKSFREQRKPLPLACLHAASAQQLHFMMIKHITLEPLRMTPALAVDLTILKILNSLIYSTSLHLYSCLY